MTAYFDLNTTGYYGEHIKALKRLRGLTYPRLEAKLVAAGIEHQNKPVTLDQIKQWAAGNVRIPAWAQDAIIAVAKLDEDYFSVDITESNNARGTNRGGSRIKSTKVGGGPSPFVRVRRVTVNDEVNLKHELTGPALHWIEVPDWFVEDGLYCARIDTDAWYPYAEREDALVVRSSGVYRHGKMCLVTRKHDGKSFCVRAIKIRGRFWLHGPGMREKALADEFWNDGLVLARLPDYIEGRLRVNAADEDGIDAEDLASAHTTT